MPSNFDNQFARVGEPGLQKHFGLTILYVDASEELDIEARVTREEQKRRQNQFGGWDVVTVRTARFPTPVFPSDPDYKIRLDGIVSIEEKEYSIEDIQAIEGNRTELRLVRTEIGELSRPGFRR